MSNIPETIYKPFIDSPYQTPPFCKPDQNSPFCQHSYKKDNKESKSLTSIALNILLGASALALAGYAGFKINQIYFTKEPLSCPPSSCSNENSAKNSIFNIQEGLGEGRTVTKCEQFFINNQTPSLLSDPTIKEQIKTIHMICEDDKNNFFFPKGKLHGSAVIQWMNGQQTTHSYSNQEFEEAITSNKKT